MRNLSTITLLLTLGLATHVRGQSMVTRERQVDSLFAAAESARRLVAQYDDSVLRARPVLDSIVRGPMWVAYESSLATIARYAVEHAADSLAALFGAHLAFANPHRYIMREESSDAGGISARADVIGVSELSASGREIQSWRNQRDTSDVRHALFVSAVRGVLLSRAADVIGWMGGHAPIDSVTSAEWVHHRMQLVSSPTSIGTRCHAGELRACRLALRISATGDAVTDWYDAEARRRLVITHRSASDRTNPRTVGECEAGSDSACIWVMRHLPADIIGNPVHASVRLGLARFAVSMGGEGAMQRILESGTIEQRIAAAANAPLDTVLAHWNRRIRETVPPSHNVPPSIAMTTVLWVMALGLLSLRSSRWR